MIEPGQRTAAKVAGAWYLIAMAAGIFAEIFIRSRLVVPGDVAQTASNIIASSGLYRIGTVSHLLVFAGDVVLLVSLYIILSPINRGVALLAAAWRLLDSTVLATILLCDFALLRLLSGAEYLNAFDTKQLQALAQLAYSVEGAGFQIGFVFLGLGSTVFSLLWLKSRYVPRAIAGWGIFASLVLAFGTIAVMLFPRLSAIGMSYMAPMFFYEVGLGLWLLVKGIR